MRDLHIDCETCSEADLRRVGAWKYSKHPSTQVICMAYGEREGPIETWVPSRDGPLPADFFDDVNIHAWNISFEIAILKNVLQIPYPWVASGVNDTMAAAAVHGLPLSLDLAAPAAGLPFGKDKAGSRLMKQMSRPRGYNDDGSPRWWHLESDVKLDKLIGYCVQDVRTERGVSRLVPELNPTENRIWIMDYLANRRGVRLDRELVGALSRLVENEQERLRLELSGLTGNTVTSPAQTDKLRYWLGRTCNVPLPDLRAKTVEDTLLTWGDMLPHARRALEIRKAYSKSSTAKLKAMTECADDDDDRMRGLIQYYGAGRTGRFAGRLIQPQNLPRPNLKQKEIEKAVGLIKSGITNTSLKAFYGSPLDVASSCLRACLIPSDGHTFFSVDFSQIEARILAWFAGQTDVVQAFERGNDVYTLQANKIGSTDRFLGKVLTLACGYQMGGPRFQETADMYGLKLTTQEAVEYVTAWRQANPAIVVYWCRNHDRLRAAADVERDMDVVLPNGRRLLYRNVRYAGDGEIVYTGLNPFTRKWGPVKIYGGKLVENIVQATARDVMTAAMARVDTHNWVRGTFGDMVLTVHDELLYELKTPKDPEAVLSELLQVVTERPNWAQTLPIAAEGWHGDRYRK